LLLFPLSEKTELIKQMKKSTVVTFETSVQQWLHPSMSELASWLKCVYLKLKLKQSNSLHLAKPIRQVATFAKPIIQRNSLEDAAGRIARIHAELKLLLGHSLRTQGKHAAYPCYYLCLSDIQNEDSDASSVQLYCC